MNISFDSDLHWTPLSDDLFNPVVGFFHDPLAVSANGDIMTFGITKEDEEDTNEGALEEIFFPSIPQAAMPDSMFRTASKARFISVASLNNIAKIHVRRRGDRCMGLWIEHSDGMVEILGQWDPSESSQISEIYRKSQGPLQRLSFHFEETFPPSSARGQLFGGRIEFCSEVRLVVGDDPSTPIDATEEDVYIIEDMNTVSYTSTQYMTAFLTYIDHRMVVQLGKRLRGAMEWFLLRASVWQIGSS
jgi:hypothetical protein